MDLLIRRLPPRLMAQRKMGNRNTNFDLFLCECLGNMEAFHFFYKMFRKKKNKSSVFMFYIKVLSASLSTYFWPHCVHDVCLQVSIIVF